MSNLHIDSSGESMNADQLAPMSPGKAAQRKRMYEGLSCITVDADCGEYEMKGVKFFDVPDEEYVHGNLTGIRVVCEMLNLAAQDDSCDFLEGVLCEAYAVLESDERCARTISRRGAAVGFIATLQDVFNFAAANLDFSKVFKDKFSYYEEYLAESLKDMRKENAALVKLAAGSKRSIERGEGAKRPKIAA